MMIRIIGIMIKIIGMKRMIRGSRIIRVVRTIIEIIRVIRMTTIRIIRMITKKSYHVLKYTVRLVLFLHTGNN